MSVEVSRWLHWLDGYAHWLIRERADVPASSCVPESANPARWLDRYLFERDARPER
jgi:hypothetical protein